MMITNEDVQNLKDALNGLKGYLTYYDAPINKCEECLNIVDKLPKFIHNYNLMLDYLKQKSKPDTMCGLHEAIYNQITAKEASEIIDKLYERYVHIDKGVDNA